MEEKHRTSENSPKELHVFVIYFGIANVKWAISFLALENFFFAPKSPFTDLMQFNGRNVYTHIYLCVCVCLFVYLYVCTKYECVSE